MNEVQHWSEKRLWQLQPVRDLGILMLALLVGAAAIRLFIVTGPALLALLLAALCNPIFRLAERRLRLPRWLTAVIFLCGFLALGSLAVLWLAPRVAQEAEQLAERLPEQVAAARIWLAERGWFPQGEGSGLKPGEMLRGGISAVGQATSVLGSVVTALVLGVYSLALFAFFSVRFESLPDLHRYLPRSRRERWAHMVRGFADTFIGYLRGQMVVAAFTTTAFAVGFSLIGVPFALVAALFGGLLSFIPNGQVSGLLCAWFFGIVGGAASDLLSTFVYPALVYTLSQSLETFVVTPMVQGKQTKLHPLIVLSALLAGASAGGVIGIFLAIPVAACIKILGVDLVLPELRRFSERR